MSNSDSIWRPYTQHKTMGALIDISRGDGPYLYTNDGRQILDLISSWWVNIHGHCHRAIAEAISRQAHQLEHVIFAGMNHEPAQHLTDGLLAQTGDPFHHVFFSDNGSTAVEAALKMTLHEAANRGKPERTRLIAFDGGYHGDTWAAMAAGKTSGFFNAYGSFEEPHITHLPYPETWDGDPEVEQKEEDSLTKFRRLLEIDGNRTAGLIVEPLVQGASGMRMCRPRWLQSIVTLAREHGIRVVFDEVMTGFGRTGTMFAFQNLPENIRPDIICLSKGITGGFLPLSVTITTADVFDAFLGDSFSTAFAHGHSYTANPIACAAACASLKLFEQEATLEKFASLNAVHRELLPGLPGTVRHRICGSIAACNIEALSGTYASEISVQLRSSFLENGILLRPLGNTLYFMPPACTEPETLKSSYSIAADVLNSVVRTSGSAA